MGEKQISYNQAFGELQKILSDIKERNMDVDELSDKVKRARKLIDICEKRIKQVEMEVEEVTKEFSQN